MVPLASVDDVQARRSGGVFTDEEATRVEALLADASSRVRIHTGQDITLGDHTAILRPEWHNRPFSRDRIGARTNGVVRLPQRPVVSVASVVDGQAHAVPFLWDGLELTVGNLDGAVINASTAPTRQAVTVAYTAGLASGDRDMDAVIGIVCQMVLRVFGVNPELAGLSNRQITNYSESIGPVAAAGGIGLMNEEKSALDELFPPRPGVTWQR